MARASIKTGDSWHAQPLSIAVSAKKVALIGDYMPSFAPHVATMAAVQHSSAELGVNVEAEWLSTADVDDEVGSEYAGIWVAPGSPYKSLNGALHAIRVARERGIPCLGTCGGFQHMVLEYARNVLSLSDAQHAEYDPYASRLFITALDCSLAGRVMTLRFTPGSRIAGIYGSVEAEEQYYCNFGVNPDAVPLLCDGTLKVTGTDDDGDVRAIELNSHAFFIGTLFVPQMRSSAGRSHPLVDAFLRVVVETHTGVMR